MIRIPEDAEYYIKDFDKITFYKKVNSKSFNFLLHFSERKQVWAVTCGFLPWNDLIPIEKLNEGEKVSTLKIIEQEKTSKNPQLQDINVGEVFKYSDSVFMRLRPSRENKFTYVDLRNYVIWYPPEKALKVLVIPQRATLGIEDESHN